MSWGGQARPGQARQLSQTEGSAMLALGWVSTQRRTLSLCYRRVRRHSCDRAGCVSLISPGELYLHSLSVKEVKAHYQAREAQTLFEVAKIQQLWQAVGQGLLLKSIQSRPALCSALEYKRQLFQAVPGVCHQFCISLMAFRTLFSI